MEKPSYAEDTSGSMKQHSHVHPHMLHKHNATLCMKKPSAFVSAKDTSFLLFRWLKEYKHIGLRGCAFGITEHGRKYSHWAWKEHSIVTYVHSAAAVSNVNTELRDTLKRINVFYPSATHQVFKTSSETKKKEKIWKHACIWIHGPFRQQRHSVWVYRLIHDKTHTVLIISLGSMWF